MTKPGPASAFAASVKGNQLTGELRGWALLGIGSLALAGVFALLLALSRVPGIENTFPWPLGFFEKGLVIHVIFSFVVWFLAVFGVLVTAITALSGDTAGALKLKSVGTLSLWGGVAGVILLAIPGLIDRSEASLNNYVPIIIDPLYYAGLIIFAVSLCLIIIRFLVNAKKSLDFSAAYTEMAVACSIVLLAAFVCFLLAYIPRYEDIADARFNEDVFWGGGHALQYLNTLLMLCGWYLLAHQVIGDPPISRKVLRTVLILCVMPPLLMPYLYALFDPDSGALISIFTDLQYLLAPPVLVMGLALVVSFKKHLSGQKLPLNDIGFLCIFLSIITFAIGGFLGLFVDGADTRTPAHYHAVIAAVNIVFMGLFLNFVLPVIERSIDQNRRTRVLIWLYAVGQMIASVGLFLAGGYGAPRKTAGEEQGLVAMGAKIGLYMNGVGAAIAVIGGVMFIWICARALLRKKI
ncbi:MAG: hypothetical protein HON65_11940 [Rhodospirillales bacterium]|jgi:cytochrome c oxidase subunit I|nr:hypothetical protein [Rhodospirillales bacterium]